MPQQDLARILGYGGLIPFAALALGAWIADPVWLDRIRLGQLAYGIAILSFLGGLHWSAAMLGTQLDEEQSRHALVWSVIPALLAWIAAIAGNAALWILVVGFLAAYQVDRTLYAWYGMPDWMLRLRLHLTLVVSILLVASALAFHQRA